MNSISDRLFSRALVRAAVPAFLALLGYASIGVRPASAWDEAAAPAVEPVISTEIDADSPLAQDNALIDQQTILEFRREQTKYFNALRVADPKAPTMSLVKTGIRVRVLSMSVPEFRGSMGLLRKTLHRDLKQFLGERQTNPRIKQQFREMVLEEIVAHCRELLKNHFLVRMQAATLLSELNTIEENRTTSTPATPYDKALIPLREIVTDPDQHVSVKITALRGIHRLLTSPMLNYSGNDQLDTAVLLEAQLRSHETHWWYQNTLVQTLMASEVATDRDQKPFVVQILAEVMADPKRDPRVRCSAALAIGRVPLDPKVNLSALSYQVAALTREMFDAYNLNPTGVYWNQCFMDLYGAFQAFNAAERNDKKGLVLQSQTGVFSQHQQLVDAAFKQVATVVNGVFTNRGSTVLPQNVSAPLIDWLKTNHPGEIVVYPGARPISLTPPVGTSVTGR